MRFLIIKLKQLMRKRSAGFVQKVENRLYKENGIYTHVAIINDEVVGTIGGILSDNGISEIYLFYIDQNFRYKGIGTKLLDAITLGHAKKDATKQAVSVEEGNEFGTPFYIARGFK